MKLAKSIDLYSSCIDYVITDDDGKIIEPLFLTNAELKKYQHAPFTVHHGYSGYITKRVYGKLAITIDITPDGEK